MTIQADHARQREARVWEDTIVIALRDAQWLRSQESTDAQRKRPAPIVPAGLVKLDGRAESHLGDIALAAGERLFIIEVKAGKAQVRDEWRRGKQFRPKKVYSRLSDLVDHCNRHDPPISEDDLMDRLLMSSLNGHLVAYWGTFKNRETGMPESNILLVPYLQAMIDSLSETDVPEADMITHMPISKAYAVRASHPPRVATPHDLGRSHCRLFYQDTNGQPILYKDPLGLSADAFQEYVDYLCRASGMLTEGEPINAIVLSSQGTFFQVIGNIQDLATILSLDFVQKHEIEAKQARAFEQEPEQEDDGLELSR